MASPIIVGHERNQRYLERALRRGTLAHAYLFSGPERIGKRAVALACARSLLCANTPTAFGGCRSCDNCQAAADLRHPDLVFLSRERPLTDEGEKRSIGIKSIHELARRLSLAPWAGGRKVAIIDGSDTVSRDGQSALLKTLEDPPRATVFFLITAERGGLLSTIISRAVTLSFGLVPDAAMELLLRGVPQGRRLALLRIAAGRPGTLAALAEDPSALAAAEETERRFDELLRSGLAERFAFSDRASRDPGSLEACFVSFSRILRGELRRRSSAPGDAALLAPALAVLLRAHALLAAVPVNRRLLADWLFATLPVPAVRSQP